MFWCFGPQNSLRSHLTAAEIPKKIWGEHTLASAYTLTYALAGTSTDKLDQCNFASTAWGLSRNGNSWGHSVGIWMILELAWKWIWGYMGRTFVSGNYRIPQMESVYQFQFKHIIIVWNYWIPVVNWNLTWNRVYWVKIKIKVSAEWMQIALYPQFHCPAYKYLAWVHHLKGI